MKVEVWSDFTCPFCYIGKKHLEMALEKSNLKQKVKIEFKSFRLGLSPKSDKSEHLQQVLMNSNDMSIDKIRKMTSQINELAKQCGVTFQLEHIEYTDTFNAHRLTKYAETMGKEQELINLIFEKYFFDQENIGENDVLLSIAKEIGLGEEEVDALLCLNNYSKSVKLDEETARDIGIDGVPFFIFNEQYAVAGAQPIEVFIEVLEESKKELNGKLGLIEPTADTCKTSYCTGSDCKE